MGTRGTVRAWHDEDGWGVIDSPSTPDGCWVHYSAVLVPGHRTLEVGTVVEFSYESVAQDGFTFRAVEVWPAGRAPHRPRPDEPDETTAYRSYLRLGREGQSGPGAEG